MKKRSECDCICHQEGVNAMHVIPCCTPEIDMAEIELRALTKLRMDAENTEAFNRDSDPSSVDIAKLRTLLSLKDAETILAGGVVKPVDFYKDRAAELFACKPEVVTDKMRRFAEYYAFA